MNPGYQNPDLLEPAGPTDPEVSFLSVQSPDGRPIALLANYSLHYVGGVPPPARPTTSAPSPSGSSSCSGPTASTRRSSASCPTAPAATSTTSTSAAPPRPASRPTSRSATSPTAWPGRHSTAYKRIEYRDWVALAMAEQEIELGVRQPDARTIARAEEILAKAKGPVLDDADRRSTPARRSCCAKYPAAVKVKLQAFRIGELGIAADPVRGVRRDRPGDQAEEPAEADLHHRAGQRLQRLPADPRAAPPRRLRDLAGPVELPGGGRLDDDHVHPAGTPQPVRPRP